MRRSPFTYLKKETGSLSGNVQKRVVSNSGAVLCIILASYSMIVLDISFIVTALPKIQEEFEFSTTGISWVQNIYTLVFGGLLLLGARMGDILGQKRMFLTGLFIFTFSSFMISVSESIVLLLLFRGIQGIGSAILTPTELALISTNFAEGNSRTRAIAYYGAVAGIGASIGFVLGGMFAGLFSWRVGFLLNFLIGAALFFAARKLILETSRHSGRFDLWGAISSTLGMIGLVFGIVHSSKAGWFDQVTLISFLGGILLIILFVFHERRVKYPILPLRLFTDIERSSAYLARMLFMGAMMGFWFFTTQLLQKGIGMSPFEAGVAFLPMSLVNFGVALLVPELTRLLGNRLLLTLGISVCFFGMYWLSKVSAQTQYIPGIIVPMLLLGIGQGAALSPLTISGISNVLNEDAGAASGLVNVAHRVGGSLGLAILVALFASTGSEATDPKNLLSIRMSSAFSGAYVMLLLSFIIVVGFTVVLSIRKR